MKLGVLALQGAFDAHARALERLGHETRKVRAPGDLEALDGLVLPGGESTVQLKLVERFGLREPLAAFVAAGAPVLATCAGLILAAREVTNPAQQSFGWLDVTVARNAWGRQVESFEAVADDGVPPASGARCRAAGSGSSEASQVNVRGEVPSDARASGTHLRHLPLVLIRGPRITRAGEGVEVLATLRGEPMLVRQGNVTGATFHPELTDRLDVHRDVFGARVLAVRS